MSWCSLTLVSVVLMHHGTLKPTPIDDLTINLNLSDASNDEETSGDETFDEGQQVKAGQTNEETAILIGGFGSDRRAQTDVQIFENGVWKYSRVLPGPRKCMGTANIDNVIYVAGGIGERDDDILDTVLYRNTIGDWINHSVLKQKRSCATLNTIRNKPLHQNTLMVTGGLDENNQPMRSTEIHSPGVGWLTAPPMFDTRYGHAAVVLESRLFILGGDGSCVFTGCAAEIFDTTIQTWTRGPKLTEERRYPAAALYWINNLAFIYICGGIRGPEDNKHFLHSCERGNENGFVKIEYMKSARAQFGLLNIGTELWAIGGVTINGEDSRTVEKYSIDTNQTWIYLPYSSFMRRGRKLFESATISI